MSDVPTRWTRRAANSLLAGYIASVAAWPRRVVAASSTQTPLQQALQSLFESLDHACAVGQICLNALPPDAHALALLEAEILAVVHKDSAQGALRHHVADRMSDDFANGHVVQIDGWHLSVTEARLYTLVAVNFAPAA